MAQTLKNRRMRARGFNRRLAGLLGGRTFRGIGNRATLTTAQGVNKNVTFLAETPGVYGNGVTVAFVVAGNNTPLTVTVATKAITVNVGTGSGGAAVSTAKQVVDAVNMNSQVLVWAQLAPQSDGTSPVAALGATALSGATA